MYELVEQADNTYNNCYVLGTVYGFFEGENAAVYPLRVTSYDDRAYSIMIDNVDYVLPKEYLAQLGYVK